MMGSIKTRTAICVLLFSAALALVGTAIVRFNRDVCCTKPETLTQEQRLNALEKLTPQSSTVRAMVRGEKANEEAQKEVEQSGR